MATLSTLRELLAPTTLPEELVEEVLADTNTLWLLGVPDELVASELVLCHPPLRPGEVRAVVNATDQPATWRVTVATADQPGLLACTAGTLSQAGLSIVEAAATVLSCSRLALQRLTVSALSSHLDQAAWSALGQELRSNLAAHTHPAPTAFKPRGPVLVEAQPQDLGRSVVTVEAPDQVGLLHAAAAFLEAAGCNVEAARASADGGRARGVLIVTGPVDTAGLAAAIGGTTRESLVTLVATTPLHVAADLAGRVMELGLGAVRAAGALLRGQ